MPIIRFPFHHAVQHESGASDRIVYSGNLVAGYAKQSHYNNIDYNSKHYWFDLYYEIPSDAYKYTYRGYAEPKFNVVTSTRRYYMDIYPSSGDTRYSVEDDGTTYTDYTFYPRNNQPMTTHLTPGVILNYPFWLEEYDFTIMQTSESEYLDALMSTTWGFTNTEQTYDSDVWKQYRKISTLYTFNNVENSYCEFDAQPVDLIISPIYPVNVYASKERDLIVDWDLTNSINRREELLYQTSNVVTITDKNGDSIETGITGSTDSQVTFDTEDLAELSIGECTVNILVNSNYGTTGEATATFNLVGQSDAPEITSVTQNSYPTISWDSTDQISWEMIISNSQGVVYKSGMVIGSEQSFTVPILLEDGGYSIELRYVNSYGLLTAWGSAFVDLQPTKPDAPEGIIVSARTDYGVSVSCSDMETTGKLLAVRRKDENSTPVVLGEYNGSFVDYLIGLNDYHQYTIRNYVQGYADGEWIDGVVLADGEVVRDADDYSKFIHVWKTDEAVPNYAISEDKSDVLVQCIGRKYPVAELGEWVTSTRSFSGHVSDVDFKKLRNMKLNSSHVLLQGNEEYMPCYMEFSDAGQYIDGGRMINFNMTRIDGEK